MPSRLFELCNLLGPPSLNRFVRLFPIIYNLVTKRVNQWIFNSSSRKSYCLYLPGFIFIPFSTAQSCKLPRPFCNYPMLFLFVIVLQSSTNSLILEKIFLQISFTYTRNSSGPKTLPCGTPEVTLISLDSCPPTLTLCVRPTRNSLTKDYPRIHARGRQFS